MSSFIFFSLIFLIHNFIKYLCGMFVVEFDFLDGFWTEHLRRTRRPQQLTESGQIGLHAHFSLARYYLRLLVKFTNNLFFFSIYFFFWLDSLAQHFKTASWLNPRHVARSSWCIQCKFPVFCDWMVSINSSFVHTIASSFNVVITGVSSKVVEESLYCLSM